MPAGRSLDGVRGGTPKLMFFGDALPAANAERLGLVNRVVPDDELAATAHAWARRLAEGPTRALALTKQLVNASLCSDRATAFTAEAMAQELNMTTRDAQEGVASFGPVIAADVERHRAPRGAGPACALPGAGGVAAPSDPSQVGYGTPESSARPPSSSSRMSADPSALFQTPVICRAGESGGS